MKPAIRARVLLFVWLLGQLAGAQSHTNATPAAVADVSSSIRTHMNYLAGDALEGRGSATPQEHKAAEFVASELRRYGVDPAEDDGGYLQRVALEYLSLTAAPVLSFESGGQEIEWTHGKQIAVAKMANPDVTGPLQKISDSDTSVKVVPGAVVLLPAGEDSSSWQRASNFTLRGAAMVLVPETAALDSSWRDATRELPRLAPHLKRIPGTTDIREMTMVLVRAREAKLLSSIPDGTPLHLRSPTKPAESGETWNTIGILSGADPNLRDQAVLFSAHIDHLGVRSTGGTRLIYHGADDDASGVSAVLELARAISAGPRPRRTVLFAFFGSEEIGSLGSTYFSDYPPVPLAHIVAALEFEMLGRPDHSIPAHKLWLSGYERSDLGTELAAHGAPLVADPHLEEHFFRRSDNYPLARKGVVAHTVSSYGLHRDYHRPSDNLAHIDFPHLTEAIQSMIPAAEWLTNSDFTPHWLPGEVPE